MKIYVGSEKEKQEMISALEFLLEYRNDIGVHHSYFPDLTILDELLKNPNCIVAYKPSAPILRNMEDMYDGC